MALPQDRSDRPAGKSGPRSVAGIPVSQWLVALGIAALLVPLSLPTHTGNDEGMWLYMGRIWVDHAMPPYTHAVENKTPGIFMLYALTSLCFGTTPLPPRLLAIAAIALGSLVVGAIARRAGSPPAPLLAQTIFGLTMGWHVLEGRYTAQTETFMVLFTALSFLTLLRVCQAPRNRVGMWLFASGALLGVAVVFKQVALFSALGWLATYALHASPTLEVRRFLRGAVLLAAGIVSVNLLSLVPLLLSGVTVADYVQGAWLILLAGASSRSFAFEKGGIAEVMAQGLTRQHSAFIETWTDTRMVRFYPFLCLAAIRPKLSRDRVVLGLFAWLLCDFLGANASGYYFGHQLKQVVPALAVIVAVLLADSLKALRAKGHRLRWAGAVLLVTVLLVWFPNEELDKGLRQWRDGSPDRGRELGEWMDRHAVEDARVYVADSGCNSVLAHSGRVAPGRYFNTVFLGHGRALEETLEALHAHPPTYIVKHYPWKIPPDLITYIRRNYRPTGRWHGYEVHVRR